MAESYEYPPSLTNYRPLLLDRASYRPISLKLNHHFFITRAKIVFKEIFLMEQSPLHRRNLRTEMHNILISQGWCSALGIPVPTPFFLQEFLLSKFQDDDEPVWMGVGIVSLLLSLEISDQERRFHDAIMGGDGRWWTTEGAEAPAFDVFWQRLEERMITVVDACILEPEALDALTPETVPQILDPQKTTEQSGSEQTQGKDRQVPECSPEDQDLAEILHDIELNAISLSEQDRGDLERIAELKDAESQLVRLLEIEAETVKTEKWNYDAVVQLLELGVSQKEIPFGTREELFNQQPTGTDALGMDTSDAAGPSRKGKERAAKDQRKKRSIYHVLPAAAQKVWLGEANTAMPPMDPEEKVEMDELVEHTLPELFGKDAPQHDCVYQELVKRFVKEDMQRMSFERLKDFLKAQEHAINISLGTWSDLPPLGKLPQGGKKNEDLVPVIFQHIAAIAEATVPPTAATCSDPPETPSGSEGKKNGDPVPVIVQPIAAIGEATVPPTASTCSDPPETPSVSDEESDQSSEWESEASSEEGMEVTLELDVDMGDATFATS